MCVWIKFNPYPPTPSYTYTLYIPQHFSSAHSQEGALSYERARDECFGLLHGGAIFGLFIGAIIIIVGLQQLFGWDIDIGPFVTIIVGILIAAGAIYGVSRRKS